MIFEFESRRQTSTLRALFEPDDRYTGERQEGYGNAITYSGEEITFDYSVDSIHPDLLGLLCLIIFYPFIGERVVFPMAVSPRLQEAFQKPSFKRRFRFDNVDPSLELYSGSKMALSFGGGIDSSAIRVIFPEAFVVHEAHLRDGCLVESHTHDIVREFGRENGKIVTTNQRYISLPSGWHGWTCAFATSLLLATDYDFGIILMGSTLANTLLFNGARYWDRFGARRYHGFTGNFWQSAFNEIGIPVYSPVCGASEYLTMKLSLDLIAQDKVVYCTAEEGRACFRCTKCFRRSVVRAVVDHGYRPDWDRYDQKLVHKFLENRPLYYSHVFSYAKSRINRMPRFISSRLKDIPDIESDWLNRVYTRTFEFCDERWRPAISERVLEYLDPMEEEHVKEMQDWDVSRSSRRQLSMGRRLVLAKKRVMGR